MGTKMDAAGFEEHLDAAPASSGGADASDSLQELLAKVLEGRAEVLAASADPVTGIVDVKLRLPELPMAERAELVSWVTHRFAVAEAMVAENGFIFAPSFG